MKTKEEIFNAIPFLDKKGDWFTMSRTRVLEAMEQYKSQPGEREGVKSPEDYLYPIDTNGAWPYKIFSRENVLKALTAQAVDHAQEMEAFAQFSQDTIKELFRLMIEAAPDRTLSEIVLTISPTSEFLEAFRSSRTGEGKEGG